MILFKEAVAVEKYLAKSKGEGKIIGFVPTMGALHKGHITLINTCKEKCDITVCSIFINPTQFTDAKDFEKYPVTTGNDILQLEEVSCDVLFLPSVNEIYPAGTSALPHYDLGELENVLEGKYRPGHFQGVCQVVHRLISIISPDFIFLGQKDYQQCLVIKKLVQLMNLDVMVEVVDTLRESSGLAMSSRNLRLSESQKEDATAISEMLWFIKENYATHDYDEIETTAREHLLKVGFSKVDYVTIANAETLQPAGKGPDEALVVVAAATIGEVRLIDNMILTG